MGSADVEFFASTAPQKRRFCAQKSRFYDQQKDRKRLVLEPKTKHPITYYVTGSADVELFASNRARKTTFFCTKAPILPPAKKSKTPRVGTQNKASHHIILLCHGLC